MTEAEMLQTTHLGDFFFELEICFGFRASDFVLRRDAFWWEPRGRGNQGDGEPRGRESF